MRIGRLRARLRGNTAWCVKPEYYLYCTSFKAFGGKVEAQICPFDGKAFLNWDWRWQDNEVWYGHSANGLVPAALIDYPLEGRKETKTNKKDWCFLTLFSGYYSNVNIVVNYTYSLEGAWIKASNTSHITVLETTRVKVEFKAETREVLLPPGATIFLSQLTLMQKLGENISVRKRERPLPTQAIEVFTSAETPQELASRLELEPIRLREEVEDKGEVMRR